MSKISIIVIVIATVLQAVPLSDTCKQETWVTNGLVNAIAPSGNRIYIGGEFTTVGPYTGGGISIDMQTGLPTSLYPHINGSVFAACSDGHGGFFVGGYFTSANGIASNNIAHILPDGRTDTSWIANVGPGEYLVECLVLNKTTVYVGGSFTAINGQNRNNIAALDATTGKVKPWNPDANSSVKALSLFGTTVYAGGDFTSIGGQSRKYIASIDTGSGIVSSWNPNALDGPYSTAGINSMAISGSIIYLGGCFGGIGGQICTNIAAFDLKTGNVTAWKPNPPFYAFAIALSGGIVYAAGYEPTGSNKNIAAFDSLTGNAIAWNPNVNGVVWSLAATGTTIYAGGGFTTIGGQNRNYLAALDVTTGNATGWNPNPNKSYVYSLVPNGSTIFVGGDFSSIGGQNRNYLAALDAITGKAVNWNPNANNVVKSLAVNGAKVYTGGTFTSIGSQNRNHIAAIDTSTGTALAWNPNADGDVLSLILNGETIYAGGSFAHIGGSNHAYLSALDTGAGTALSWNPNANEDVFTLALSGSTLYAGGYFSSIGGQNRSYIAALDVLTGNATNWNPTANLNGYVYDISVNGSTVYAGGDFTSMGGQNRNYIAALDALTGTALAWNPNASSTVEAIAISGSTIYAGGSFSRIGGQNIVGLAAVDTAEGKAFDWNLNGNCSIRSLALSGTTLYVGGYYLGIGSGLAHPFFAQFGNFYSAPVVQSVTPSSSLNSGSVQITNLNGSGFRTGATVKLTKTGQADISATAVSVIASTQITCAINITNTATGAWDVVVTNDDTKSGFLKKGFIVTSDTLPFVVTLKSPATGDTVKIDSVFLTWFTSTPQVDRYAVEYASDSMFTNPTIDTTVTDTVKLIPNLQQNSTVWWRVKAHNAAGWGTWSTKYVFMVKHLSTQVRLSAIQKTFSFNIYSLTGTVRYALPKAEHVLLRLYNANGQLLSESINMQQGAGYYSMNLQKDLSAAGSYLVEFRAGEYHQQKMIFLMK